MSRVLTSAYSLHLLPSGFTMTWPPGNGEFLYKIFTQKNPFHFPENARTGFFFSGSIKAAVGFYRYPRCPSWDLLCIFSYGLHCRRQQLQQILIQTNSNISAHYHSNNKMTGIVPNPPRKEDFVQRPSNSWCADLFSCGMRNIVLKEGGGRNSSWSKFTIDVLMKVQKYRIFTHTTCWSWSKQLADEPGKL